MTDNSESHPKGLLDGVRIIECVDARAGRDHQRLVDLGAEVIKVEPPAGDYIRRMTWPIVEASR